MYARPESRETRTEVLVEAIRALRLGALVAAGPEGLVAAHLPVVVREAGGALTLEAHVARGNPIWRAAGPAVALFQGPHAYVHPGWYPSKRETAKVVPTWTYVAVHAHGRLEAVADDAWLDAHVRALTDVHEAPRAEPWAVDDAPADYLAAMRRGIVGLRLEVERLEGVWKLNQHHAAPNREGVKAGLAASDDPADRAVAALFRVEGHGAPD